MSVFEPALRVVGSSRKQAELVAAAVDPNPLVALLRAERYKLWRPIAVDVANKHWLCGGHGLL